MSPGAFVAIVGVVVLIAVPFLIYNGLIRARNLVTNSWALVDTELQRRHDLVPNLVETVKGYAAHEQQVFEAVTNARARATNAIGTPDAREAPEAALVAGIGQLFAVAEAYPDLKASEQFLGLQRRLVDTEDRIAVARRVFNANVRDYNTRIQSFPGLLFARGGRFAPAHSFDVGGVVRNEGPPAITNL